MFYSIVFTNLLKEYKQYSRISYLITSIKLRALYKPYILIERH